MMFASWHFQPQRLAFTSGVDLAETGRGEAAGGAVALFVDFELDLARAERRGAAPDQRFAREAHAAPVRIDCFDKAEDAFRLAADIRMQAFARLDAIPAARRDALA